MNLLSLFPLLLLVAFGCLIPTGNASPLTVESMRGSLADFPLILNEQVATFLVDNTEAEVVQIAAGLLAEDVASVTGKMPLLVGVLDKETGPVVILGTIGQITLIADLIKRGKLDVSATAGKWESFIVQTVLAPFPDVPVALVVAGSDPRGTAYGAVTVSETIGVSPWIWWADVVPPRRESIVLVGAQTQGPPSVKYRGIFINDEDWGLQPWSAQTFEPEAKDIGPRPTPRSANSYCA